MNIHELNVGDLIQMRPSVKGLNWYTEIPRKVVEIDRHERVVLIEGDDDWYDIDHFTIKKEYYNQLPKEVIEIMEFTFGTEAVINFCRVNAMKYRLRLGHKEGQDSQVEVEKALWYEEKARELSQKLEETD